MTLGSRTRSYIGAHRRLAAIFWLGRYGDAPNYLVNRLHRDTRQDPFPEEDVVWGVAYTIDPEYAVEVKAYLGDVYIVLDVMSTLTTTLRPSGEGAYVRA